MNYRKKLTLLLLVAISLHVPKTEASAEVLIVFLGFPLIGLCIGAAVGTLVVGMPSYLITRACYKTKKPEKQEKDKTQKNKNRHRKRRKKEQIQFTEFGGVIQS